TAIVVDDGIATGSTAAAACQVATQMGSKHVILAVPVGAPESLLALSAVCDEVVCLYAPEFFMAVGTFYDNFRHVSDREVNDLLARAAVPAKVPAATARTPGPPADQAHGKQPRSGPADARSAPSSGVRTSTSTDDAPHSGSGTGTSNQTLAQPERDEPVSLNVADGAITLEGHLTVPPNATGTVIFVHGSGSSRHSPRNVF